jgi:hypothetical protein
VPNESAWHLAPYTFAAVVLGLKPCKTESQNGCLWQFRPFFWHELSEKGSIPEFFVYWLVHGLREITCLSA